MQSYDLAAVLREVHKASTTQDQSTAAAISEPVTWETFSERARQECEVRERAEKHKAGGGGGRPKAAGEKEAEVKCEEAVKLAQWWLSLPPLPPPPPPLLKLPPKSPAVAAAAAAAAVSKGKKLIAPRQEKEHSEGEQPPKCRSDLCAACCRHQP